ncbi:glycosyl transferase, group 1 [Magnetococcus marinus MC-1]|uniref:Glycosyl transferase, group 1 n=1 Tax=Magnetococcus marinus (strain ATCC BAA-1437 / JCM 17883 / MC-1) TaxID=156889 RepID=A0L851_MAGMM|nr:glycosyltransferase [Magnetococcus marinus]ABK44144.1 glycosyl transferase, group 1 [Magnetococcus marinus MC-1]
MKSLCVEGWLSLPHSFSVIHQFLCLELAKRQDVTLSQRPVPLAFPHWKEVDNLFTPKQNAILKAIPQQPLKQACEVTLRIGFPFDFSTANSERLWVFGNATAGFIHPQQLKGSRTLGEIFATPNSRIWTPSEWSKQGYVRCGAPAEWIDVVPLGVDVDIFHPVNADQKAALRQQMGLPEKALIFLAIGAMTANKGIDKLVQSFARVATQHPHVRLLLKGLSAMYGSDRSLQGILKNLSAKEQQAVEGRIHYIGGEKSFADLAQLYQVADLYLSPYKAEGFNMPVLEAIACGLPVICTAGGPTDEFILAETALTIPSVQKHEWMGNDPVLNLYADPQVLTQHMLRSVEDYPLRQLALTKGPDYVAKQYSWARIVERLLDVMFPNTSEVSPQTMHTIERSTPAQSEKELSRFGVHPHEMLMTDALRNLSMSKDRLPQGVSSERGVEIPLAMRWCLSVENFIEVGAVLPYFGMTTHTVIDWADPFPGCQRVDAETLDYRGKNVLSISTLEHVGLGDYGLQAESGKAVRLFERILHDANACFLSVPMGVNQELQHHLFKRHKQINWFAFVRQSLGEGPFVQFPHPRFRVGQDQLPRWGISQDPGVFQMAYGRPFPYANAVVFIWKDV